MYNTANNRQEGEYQQNFWVGSYELGQVGRSTLDFLCSLHSCIILSNLNTNNLLVLSSETRLETSYWKTCIVYKIYNNKKIMNIRWLRACSCIFCLFKTLPSAYTANYDDVSILADIIKKQRLDFSDHVFSKQKMIKNLFVSITA